MSAETGLLTFLDGRQRWSATIEGAIRSKKNSMRIARTKAGKPFILQSKQHNDWAEVAIEDLKALWAGRAPIESKVNLAATIYCDRWGADLLNLLAALSDALEHAGVLKNDRQVVALDGSRMLKDKDRPRVEFTIEELQP